MLQTPKQIKILEKTVDIKQKNSIGRKGKKYIYQTKISLMAYQIAHQHH